MEISVLGAALIVMISSLAGVVFLHATAERFLREKLSYLIAFSAGIFLVTAGGLMLEVFELVDTAWIGALLVAAGYVLAGTVHALMPETHHHHGDHCEQAHGVAARKLIIGDAIHNVADGVLIVVAFSVSPALGLAATVSIVIHETLQEISEFFVLRRAGFSVKKALTVNFLVSGTVLIGVALGYFALASHELEIALLALSAGFFLHVVWHDLLPRRSEHEDRKDFMVKIGLVFVGALLMATIANLLSGGHVHGEHSDHDHDHKESTHSEDEHAL